MTRLVSIGTKIEQIDGLSGTDDLNAWEENFVTNVAAQYEAAGRDSRVLSAKQVEVVERIWRKHFT